MFRICLRMFSTASMALVLACTPSADEPTVEQAPAEPTAALADDAAAMDAAMEPRLYFVSLADGDVVSNPIVIEFGIDGMAVVPAGQDVPQSGHHHLIIDAELPNLSLPVPSDDHYIHFGDGSASTERTLEQGEHTLQLLFADFLHIPHDPAVKSERITITVR